MTYSELKDELFLLRDRENQIREFIISLANVRSDYLSRLNAGVTDYSKERLQKTPDPDASTVNMIYEADRKTDFYKERLQELQDKTEPYERLIIGLEGTTGTIMRLFYLEGLGMKAISKRLHYAEKYSWHLWRKGIEELLEVINNDN